MGGKSSKPKASGITVVEEPAATPSPAADARCRVTPAQGQRRLAQRLLRDADLLPAYASQAVAVSRLAMLALYALHAESNQTLASESVPPVPRDIVFLLLAMLRNSARGWQYTHCDDTFPWSKAAAVLRHTSHQLCVAFPDISNGYIHVSSTRHGQGSIMSTPSSWPPRVPTTSGTVSRRSETLAAVFAHLEGDCVQWVDVVPGFQPPTDASVTLQWDATDEEAVAAGSTGPTFTVACKKELGGTYPARFFPNGVVRTSGLSGHTGMAVWVADDDDGADAPSSSTVPGGP